jgi:hypothetical protein
MPFGQYVPLNTRLGTYTIPADPPAVRSLANINVIRLRLRELNGTFAVNDVTSQSLKNAGGTDLSTRPAPKSI